MSEEQAPEVDHIDENGGVWYKSNLNIEPEAPKTYSPDEEAWQDAFVSAVKKTPFPEGSLIDLNVSQPSEGTTQYQWYYEPTDTGAMGAIEVDIYFSTPPSAAKALEDYNTLKAEALEPKPWREEDKAVDGWKEWPSGYPNRNNYETMEACGITTDGHRITWVQGGYLVVLSGGPMMKKGGLKEYADGIWTVVNNVGEGVEPLPRKDEEEDE